MTVKSKIYEVSLLVFMTYVSIMIFFLLSIKYYIIKIKIIKYISCMDRQILLWTGSFLEQLVHVTGSIFFLTVNTDPV